MADEREVVARHLDVVAERFCELAKDQSLKPEVCFEANAGRSFETRSVRVQFVVDSTLYGWRKAIILRCPLAITDFEDEEIVTQHVLRELVLVRKNDQIPEIAYPKVEAT